MMETPAINCSEDAASLPTESNLNQRLQAALTALRRILRVTELNARKLAREHGLSVSQLMVLQHLERNRLLPSQLARLMNVKQSTATILSRKLEQAGLVRRVPDTSDRRRIWIELTDSGRQRLASAPDLLQDQFAHRFENLRDWEQAMLMASLERTAELLEAENIEAAPVLDIGELDQPTDQA